MDPSVDKKRVTLYSDGGCDPNPGPGGWGAVLLHGDRRRELWGAYRLTTNNRMELMAVISGLEAIKMACVVDVKSDSQYVVNAMTRGWVEKWQSAGWHRKGQGPVPNSDLWKRLLAACARHQVSFHWVRGHSGVPENERCDELATQARLVERLEIDSGYDGVDARKQPLEEAAASTSDSPAEELPARSAKDAVPATLQSAKGLVLRRHHEAMLSPVPDTAVFHAAAEWLGSELHARTLYRMHDGERRQHEVEHDGVALVLDLHRHRGVTLLVRDKKDRDLLVSVARRLRKALAVSG